MKRLAIILLALSLVSCTQFRQFETGVKNVVFTITKPDTFDDITILYGSTLAAGNAYGDLCQRKVINKSCWNVIETIQPYEQKAYDSYIVLKKFVKSNPTLDATNLIKFTKDQISAWKIIQINNGVK